MQKKLLIGSLLTATTLFMGCSKENRDHQENTSTPLSLEAVYYPEELSPGAFSLVTVMVSPKKVAEQGYQYSYRQVEGGSENYLTEAGKDERLKQDHFYNSTKAVLQFDFHGNTTGDSEILFEVRAPDGTPSNSSILHTVDHAHFEFNRDSSTEQKDTIEMTVGQAKSLTFNISEDTKRSNAEYKLFVYGDEDTGNTYNGFEIYKDDDKESSIPHTQEMTISEKTITLHLKAKKQGIYSVDFFAFNKTSQSGKRIKIKLHIDPSPKFKFSGDRTEKNYLHITVENTESLPKKVDYYLTLSTSGMGGHNYATKLSKLSNVREVALSPDTNSNNPINFSKPNACILNDYSDKGPWEFCSTEEVEQLDERNNYLNFYIFADSGYGDPIEVPVYGSSRVYFNNKD